MLSSSIFSADDIFVAACVCACLLLERSDGWVGAVAVAVVDAVVDAAVMAMFRAFYKKK